MAKCMRQINKTKLIYINDKEEEIEKMFKFFSDNKVLL